MYLKTDLIRTKFSLLAPVDFSCLVVEGKWLGRTTPVCRGVFAPQLEHVLLDLGVPERLADATAIGAKEVVRHVGVEVDVIFLTDKVPLFGSCLELLVVPYWVCLIQ